MIYKQCVFVDKYDESETNDSFSVPYGGIAVYEDYQQGDLALAELQGVICGECGGWLDADACKILKVSDTWKSLDEAITNHFMVQKNSV